MGYATIVIDCRLLQRFLELPEGVTAHALHIDPMRNAVIFHVEGDCLPEVAQTEMPPIADLTMSMEATPDGYGKRSIKMTVPSKTSPDPIVLTTVTV